MFSVHVISYLLKLLLICLFIRDLSLRFKFIKTLKTEVFYVILYTTNIFLYLTPLAPG